MEGVLQRGCLNEEIVHEELSSHIDRNNRRRILEVRNRHWFACQFFIPWRPLVRQHNTIVESFAFLRSFHFVRVNDNRDVAAKPCAGSAGSDGLRDCFEHAISAADYAECSSISSWNTEEVPHSDGLAQHVFCQLKHDCAVYNVHVDQVAALFEQAVKTFIAFLIRSLYSMKVALENGQIRQVKQLAFLVITHHGNLIANTRIRGVEPKADRLSTCNT